MSYTHYIKLLIAAATDFAFLAGEYAFTWFSKNRTCAFVALDECDLMYKATDPRNAVYTRIKYIMHHLKNLPIFLLTASSTSDFSALSRDSDDEVLKLSEHWDSERERENLFKHWDPVKGLGLPTNYWEFPKHLARERDPKKALTLWEACEYHYGCQWGCISYVYY